MNSEQYLLQAIPQNFDGKIYARPNIPDKILVNAALKIANGTDTGVILACVDVSLLGDGKEGLAFSGDTVYLHETLTDVEDIEIPLMGVTAAVYEENSKTDERGKVHLIKQLTVVYTEAEPLVIQSENTRISLKSLGRVLQGLAENVEAVQTTAQDMQLKDFGEKVVLVYFELIINYLQGQENGYRELAEMMANNHLTQAVNVALREYRYDTAMQVDDDRLIELLKDEIPFGSQAIIFEALIKDLMLAKDTEQLKTWKDDVALMSLAQKLNVDENKCNAFAHFAGMQQKQIADRLDNNQVNKALNESVAVMTGAGVVAGSLMATASPAIFVAVATMSTGGLALIGLGIGAAGVGAYAGLKHLTSGKNSERYAIRNELLQDRIEKLTAAQDYLIQDINYLSDHLSEAVTNFESQTAKFDKIKIWVARVQEANRAAQADAEMREYALKERLITSLPAQIDFEKINTLADKFPRKTQNLALIQAAYDDDWVLNEGSAIKVMAQAQATLKELGYDKLATVANAKSVASQVAASDSVQDLKATVKDTMTQVASSDTVQDLKASGKKMFGRFTKFMNDTGNK